MTETGHRRTPGTVETGLEVWGPTRDECYAEAVRALLDVLGPPVPAGRAREVRVDLDPAPEEDLLVELLEEVLDLVGGSGLVPVDVSVTDRTDGGLMAELVAVPGVAEDLAADVPSAVSDHGLVFHRESDHWVCRFLMEA
ncbi:MAG: archease [Actinomycetes bacterium]